MLVALELRSRPFMSYTGAEILNETLAPIRASGLPKKGKKRE